MTTSPKFVSVRLLDADKVAYERTVEHMQRKIGIPLGTADIYRLAMQALIEKHKIVIK